MELIKRALLVLLTAGFLLGATGCDTEGPIEDTGEELEE